MMNLLRKEIKLSAAPISFLFVAFGVMAMIPNYPIMLGAFFICFGIFHTFQATRENGDIFYSAMLPVRKADVVVSKYTFVLFIQLMGLICTTVFTLIRMIAIGNVTPYAENSLMNANIAFLGYFLMVYAIFNTVFIGGFFKTAYKIGMPFVGFAIGTFIMIGIGEALHHFPGLEGLNSNVFAPIQLVPFGLGLIVWIVATMISLNTSIKSFERIDL